MLLRLSLIIMIISLLIICCGPKEEPVPLITGDYYGQIPPDITARVFAPGAICDGLGNRDMAIHPNGDKFFYSIWLPTRSGVLMQVDKIDSVWQEPIVAPFSGKYSDLEPFFTHDGRRLYFASNRPMKDGDPPKDYDIWYVELCDAGWKEPVNVGKPINTPGNEFYPTLTTDNVMYFTAPHKKSEAIYKSKMVGGKFNKPKRLSYAINSAHGEFNSMISPDGSFLIFSSFGREDDHGGGDLYISFKDDDGDWQKAVNMGDTFNSTRLDYCPALSPDGKYLFFASSRMSPELADGVLKSYSDVVNVLNSPGNGGDDIYWISTSTLERFKQK